MIFDTSKLPKQFVLLEWRKVAEQQGISKSSQDYYIAMIKKAIKTHELVASMEGMTTELSVHYLISIDEFSWENYEQKIILYKDNFTQWFTTRALELSGHSIISILDREYVLHEEIDGSVGVRLSLIEEVYRQLWYQVDYDDEQKTVTEAQGLLTSQGYSKRLALTMAKVAQPEWVQIKNSNKQGAQAAYKNEKRGTSSTEFLIQELLDIHFKHWGGRFSGDGGEKVSNKIIAGELQDTLDYSPTFSEHLARLIRPDWAKK